MRIPRMFLGLSLLALAACGGGGGEVIVEIFDFDLGALSSTAETSVDVQITSPKSDTVSVTLVDDDPFFTVAGGVLPFDVANNEIFTLPVLFRPGGQPGERNGTITLRYDDAERTYNFTATGESVSIQVNTASIDFGEVLPNTTKDETIEVENLSQMSTANITPTLPAGDFQVITPLPLAIAPGATETLTVRYAPTGPGAPSGNALVNSEDPNGPYAVPFSATTGGQEIVDLGNLTLDPAAAHGAFTARTAAMTFDVPADAVSFTIEACGDSNTQFALSELTGPGGENFEDEDFGGHYLQYPDFGEFAAVVPNADQAIQQIIPGTWTVRIGRLQGPDGDVEVRIIIERRPGPTASVGTLNLNVFLADALSVDAASAPTDPTMTDIWNRVNVLLGQQGIQIGDIAYYDLTDTAFDDVTGAEFPALLAESANATEERFNYFFVRTALGGGILGVSAKIGGGTKKGTGSSGVMGLWIENPNANQADLVARVTAHEMGHYLGWRHTAEQNGAHDGIDDTAEHGAGGGGQYLMHWNASTGGSEISNAQGAIGRGHPHISAALLPPPPPPPFTLKPAPPAPTFDILVPQHWCGTCQRCKDKRELGLGK